MIVATGGARGVTGGALKLLAKQHRPRLVLLGRTPLDREPDGLPAAAGRTELIQLLARRQPGTPAEIAAAAHRVLAAREIRETIAAIEQSNGSRADVTKQLFKIKLPSSILGAVSFNSNGDVTANPVTIYKVRSGKSTTLKVIVPPNSLVKSA